MAPPAKLKFYGAPLSQPTRSVLLLLEEAGVAYTFENVPALRAQGKFNEFLKVNPTGFVPYIEDGTLGLAEGAAILVHIAQSRALTTWYPESPKEQARVNFWLHWNHNAARKSTMEVMRPMMGGQKPKFDGFKAAVDFMEARLAESGPFLGGTEAPTIADIFILPEIDQLAVMGIFDFKPYPKVAAWLENLQAALPKSYRLTFTPLARLQRQISRAPLKVYAKIVSQPARSVLMFLEEAGVEYQLVNVGEMKPEDYRKINPTGFVPAISDKDLLLAEGAAILMHLATTRGLTKWYPADPKDQAKVNFWLYWNHGATRKGTMNIVRYAMAKRKPEPKGFKEAVEFMDARLGEAGPFLGGFDHPTIADLMILPEIDQLVGMFFDYSPYPNVLKWLEAMKGATAKSYMYSLEAAFFAMKIGNA